MKRIILRDRGVFKAREVLTTILEQPSPGTGITISDMRRRNRVLDAVELQTGTHVDLEDADHAFLKQLIDVFQFATGKRDLQRILDDISEAKAPEDTLQLKLIDDAG